MGHDADAGHSIRYGDGGRSAGRMNDVGAIAVGRYGDLIGVTGDPLQDVARLESVRDEGRRSNQSPTD